MNRILFLEENNKFAEIICKFLQAEGFSATCETSLEKALNDIKKGVYILVLASAFTGRYNPYYLCWQIRKISSIPIILLLPEQPAYEQYVNFNKIEVNTMIKYTPISRIIEKVKTTINKNYAK